MTPEERLALLESQIQALGLALQETLSALEECREAVPDITLQGSRVRVRAIQHIRRIHALTTGVLSSDQD